MVMWLKLVTQAHGKTRTFHVHRERLGQLIFQSRFVGLEPPKLGDESQIIGDGFFNSNKALEGDGVFRELPDVKVGVSTQTPKIKINARIAQADAAKDGDVQPKLLAGDRVEENGLDGSGGIGFDRAKLGQVARNQIVFGASVLQLQAESKSFGLPANGRAEAKRIVKAQFQLIPVGQDAQVVFIGLRPDAHGPHRPDVFGGSVGTKGRRTQDQEASEGHVRTTMAEFWPPKPKELERHA